MDVGHGGPGLPVRAADEAGGMLDMEGALQAPSRSPGRLADVAGDLRDALATAVDAVADHAEHRAGDATPELGPPLYGGWHANVTRVPDARPVWLRDLNLDPRSRAAAAIATEVVKENQEEFMGAAWEQVGDVLAANELLNRARLAEEAARRVHERHLRALRPDRLLAVAAGVHQRVRLGDVTVATAVAATSLPDRAADPQLRRLTSSQRPLMKRAFRRAGAIPDGAVGFVSRLVDKLASGFAGVEPGAGFVPDGLRTVAGVADVALPRGNAAVDLADTGIDVTVNAKEIRDLRQRVAAVDTAVGGPIELRPGLRTTGLVTEEHVAHARATPRVGEHVLERDVAGVLDRVVGAAADSPGAAGFLVDTTAATTTVRALDVDAHGTVVLRGGPGRRSTPVGRLGGGLARGSSAAIHAALSGLPPGALTTARPHDLPVIEGATVEHPTGPPTPTNTLPPLVTDARVVTRFTNAFHALTQAETLRFAPTGRTLVPFDLGAAATSLAASLDPAVVVPRRIATMLRAGGADLFANVADHLFVPPTHDRIWAAPDLPVPLYEYLARYDADRFLPGVGVIPDDAITLLETNPRFIEAFLVGANHEMNRELLWRGYPTDQRGTPFHRFWDWLDGDPDIEPIHTWNPNRGLGSNTRGADAGGQLVLLVRGALLRRYPNTVVYAWRSTDRGQLVDPPAATDIRRPVFGGRFDPDFTFVGFDLTDDDLRGNGWLFVLQEQPTEPRFGMDDADGTPPAPTRWSDLAWEHTGTAEGGHLRIAGSPLSGRTLDGATWVRDAGHLAAITLQQPVRVAVASRHLVVEE